MCGLSRTESLEDTFIISNIILGQEGKFDVKDLRKATQLLNNFDDDLIEESIDELLEIGSIYEVGNRYVVRKDEYTWL